MQVGDNRVRSVIDLYSTKLGSIHPPEEVKAITRLVFQEKLGWDPHQMEMAGSQGLSESELLMVYEPLKRLCTGEPLQYVLGVVHFHGLRLKVENAVLIPRPETEELVDLIMRTMRPTSMLDVGTGSGCIALALARCFAQARMIGMDISEPALKIARHNGGRYGLDVEWWQGNVLRKEFPKGPFDLIVSNPPYVPRAEAISILSTVRDHEPHEALFVPDDDPYCFYQAIAEWAMDAMMDEGHLWFETHHAGARAVADLVLAIGFAHAEVMQDTSGKERFVHATFRRNG